MTKGYGISAGRRLLFLTPAEAGQWIAGKKGERTDREWHRWESGEFNAPRHVIQRLRELLSQRATAVSKVDAGPHRWYPTWPDFQQDFPLARFEHWRMHQSVLAEAFTRRGELTNVLTHTPLHEYFTEIARESASGTPV